MTTTIFLAKLLGAFSIIAGLSMLSRRKLLMIVFKEIFRTRAFSYFLGILLLAAGLSIILQHNFWETPLEIVISILGWYLLLEAIGYMFLSERTMKGLLVWIQKKWVYYGIVSIYFIIGGYLVLAGLAG
ncbi:MAG: hypothetical protein HY764_01695 [Candidatus Portnoybacteria bacterium]|nr:hypothetical protein [Candidatus Portnoybacteria bacterium]